MNFINSTRGMQNVIIFSKVLTLEKTLGTYKEKYSREIDF